MQTNEIINDWSATLWAEHSNNWVAYIDGEAAYNGAALARLQPGRWFVIRKADGSVSIHGGDLNKPKNYLRALTVTSNDKIITCANKKEWLKIKVNRLYWVQHLHEWGTNKVELYRTEHQLVNKLVTNLDVLLPEAIGGKVIREYRILGTGAVDVGIVTADIVWLIEVKRKKVTQQTIGQVMRYRDHHVSHHTLKLVIVAPEISDNGLKYAQSNNISFIPLDWDPVPVHFEELLQA